MPPDAPGHAAPPTPDGLLDGLVIESTGSWYMVRAGEVTIPSRLPGRFRLDAVTETNPVAVGDRVRVVRGDDGTGTIESLVPRENALRRRAAGRRVGVDAVIAANVDRAWVVQSASMPALNPGLVDRFLVAAEREEIPAGIVVNKTDLALTDEAVAAALAAFVGRYRGIGYPVVETSAETGAGVDAWREALRDRVSVVSGPSGVGKSSLLNAAAPGLALRTGAVSARTKKGKHTTTNAVLHALPFGGYVVDTPGIREFGVVDVSPEDLGFYFIEFKPHIGACRFQPCTHDHEPDCAVMAALDEGAISEVRYDSYLSILDSIRLGDRGR